MTPDISLVLLAALMLAWSLAYTWIRRHQPLSPLEQLPPQETYSVTWTEISDEDTTGAEFIEKVGNTCNEIYLPRLLNVVVARMLRSPVYPLALTYIDKIVEDQTELWREEQRKGRAGDGIPK